MITKAQALERFITERVVGDRPFAVIGGHCRYGHEYAGGCEIGQYLPADVAKRCDEQQDAIYCQIRDLPGIRGVIEATLEDPDSHFWGDLQHSHDTLSALEGELAADRVGGLVPYSKYSKSLVRWSGFSTALQRAASYL